MNNKTLSELLTEISELLDECTGLESTRKKSFYYDTLTNDKDTNEPIN